MVAAREDEDMTITKKTTPRKKPATVPAQPGTPAPAKRATKTTTKPATKTATGTASTKPAVKKPAAKRAPAIKPAQRKAEPIRKGHRTKAELADAAVRDAQRKKDEEEGIEIAKTIMGRIPTYHPKFAQQMMDFFNIEVQRVVESSMPNPKGGPPIIEFNVVTNKFPTFTRFAATIGVIRETLHDWATKKKTSESGVEELRFPEFSHAYRACKDLQDALITEGGISGMYEARFTTFAAKNIIGWKDQIETVNETRVSHTTSAELDVIYEQKMAESKKAAEMAAGRKGRLGDE